jgi:diguanylate cyclase (GGDEF)-like protein
MDALTGLMSGSQIEGTITKRILSGAGSKHGFAVVVLGIDRFRHLNELLGYCAGDDALLEIASRLQAWPGCRAVARLGGDEFCVLIDGLSDLREALKSAEALLRIFNRQLHLGTRDVFLTASAGLSLYPIDGQDAVSLLRQASRAMMKTKRRGGNAVEGATEPPNLTPEQRYRLETALRRALEQEEFNLRFQPEVDRDGQFAGCEVLLSWYHPELGNVEADTFIRLAEEIGVILPIGAWVLWQACAQAKLWIDAGLNVPRIAVNVSPLQFADPEFVPTVEAVLESTGLPGDRLELELTESSVMRDIEEAVARMRSLRELGITFAIDDFGVGYSPLTYLHRLPVDVVKIDRTFIAQITKPSGSLPLVQTITVLAHRQGFQVVAEGVETREEVDLVRAVHCDRMQGYYFGAPAFTEEFESILRTPDHFSRLILTNDRDH